MGKNSYLLGVGKNGNNRLLSINNLYNQKSIDFMKKSGLSTGMKILDVGGGIGILSCLLAELVGPTGHVTVIDSSQLQIDFIVSEQKRLKINNLSAFKCSAENVSRELGCFDIVFCRFLLIHLEKPVDIIKKMLDVLNKNGLLIIEDCIFSQSFCIPRLDAFDKRLEYIQQTFKACNKDADLGNKLYKMLSDLKLTDFKIDFYQPALKEPHEKIIIPQLLQEIKDKIIYLNIASPEEINHVMLTLERFVFNPRYVAASAQVCQIRARKC